VDGPTGKTWTYSQLKDDIVKVASALTRLGFKRGEVITVFSPNCREFAVMYLAVAAIGGVCSAVNPLYTPGIIIYKNNL
jgi:acyl-coenzyme A synthetase/AMP-(fatty) acid ligase